MVVSASTETTASGVLKITTSEAAGTVPPDQLAVSFQEPAAPPTQV